ncbi:MAG: TRAM domain-containing protein, partial [Maribacter sp.]|nr:TRAM domain-containing protein [Maribacter sp.]
YRIEHYLGMVQEILIEGTSKKDTTMWKGRNSQNVVAVFPKEKYRLGDFVNVKMNDCTSATLIGEAVGLSHNN